ncbi:MAG: RuBisCO large subunit C-terminal-like domain-containing protein [Candidatus Limnocylindrales bacterium]
MTSGGGIFTLGEAARERDDVLATYYLELPDEVDVLEKAAAFAIGQTIGTWVPVPGMTDELRAKHGGRVVRVIAVPPVDLATQVTASPNGYLIQLALPALNFGPQFPMLLTTLLGNDASTSTQAKLVDLELPDTYLAEFPGPRLGIAGVRQLVGVEDRPLVLNMIKPCTGLSPEEGAKIFRATALGGVDLIKDDELLGNPAFSPIDERVRAYKRAARSAFEETGKHVAYVANVTDSPERVVDNARRAVDAGVDAVMLNYATVGYGLLQVLAAAVDVPVMGHFAGAGMSYEGPLSGMSAPIALGKLPRLAGADIAMINTPYGGYPIRRLQYLATVRELSLPHPRLAPTFPAIGGGVHPGVVELYMRELGNDIILSPGGAIQGHPDGATAGGRAMRQAIDAVMAGVALDAAAADHPELATALARWGYRKPGAASA